MADLFLVVLLLSLAAIVVSLIKPRWTLPWVAAPSRGKAVGMYCAIVLASFVGFGVTYDGPDESALPPEAQVQLVSALDELAEAFKAATKADNAIQRAEAQERIQTEHAALVDTFLSQGGVMDGWIGNIKDINVSWTSGEARFDVTLSRNVTLVASGFSQESEVYQVLRELKKGDRVIFSGSATSNFRWTGSGRITDPRLTATIDLLEKL